MVLQPTLEAARLILRPFYLSDASEVQRLAGDKDIAQPLFTFHTLMRMVW